MVKQEEIKKILDGWGISLLSLEELNSEMDSLWKVVSSSETYLLRISHPSIAEDRVDFENALLQHIERHSDVACPRLLRENRLATKEGSILHVRLFSWATGCLLKDFKPVDDDLLVQIGTELAKLTNCLQDFQHKAAGQDHIWKIDNLPWVHEHVSIFAEQDQKLVTDALASIERELVPRLPLLRTSVCYHDANDHNIVVDQRQDEIAVKFIDFGDACLTKTCLDIAIACTYLMMGRKAPWLTAMALVRGYHRCHPLSETEVEALPYLIKLRLLISLTHSTLRQQSDPSNAYNQVSNESGWTLLRYMDDHDDAWAIACFKAACWPEKKAILSQSKRWFPLLGKAIALKDLPIVDLSVQSTRLGTQAEIEDSAVLDRRIKTLLDASQMGIGRHGEPRPIYTSSAFCEASDLGDLRRTIHLGIDIFAPAGTPLYAPMDCRVYRVMNCAGPRDYGPTIILKCEDGFVLFGHLHLKDLDKIKVGQSIKKGTVFAHIGAFEHNGNWTPHVHVQYFTDWLDKRPGALGVSSPAYLSVWRKLSPSPATMLGLDSKIAEYSGVESNLLIEHRSSLLPANMSLSYDLPLHIVRGQGIHLVSARGQRYLDLVNNVAHVGHEHPRVVEAIRQQAATLNTNTRYLHQNILSFCQKLLASTPDHLEVVYLCNSGSEANDLALRMARTITGRQEVLALEGAYHGHTQSCIEVSSYKFARKGGQGRPESVQILPMPDPYRGVYENRAAVASYQHDLQLAMERFHSPPAAFIHESILSCGGQIVPPEDYFSTLYADLQAQNCLCIADEVQTGCGRMGSSFWSFEMHGLAPDMVTIGKPIGNGHPLAAVVATREVAAAFANGMEYFNTFAGNPVSCAAGSAVLDILNEEGLVSHAERMGNLIKKRMYSLQEQYPVLGDVRGEGLFIGLEFVSDSHKTPAPDLARYIVARALQYGILMSTDGLQNNVLKIKPPLVISEDQVEMFCHRISQILSHHRVADYWQT
ncbi:MAG: aminotransferase class III-fold pyridoxal phosphate-dependent enzyme [Saprospiraceae bacterium]|nr:aminotransferase class III-fold pyridoxal phosphate-dependent enzyme [Saprospiraceae bacterium]